MALKERTKVLLLGAMGDEDAKNDLIAEIELQGSGDVKSNGSVPFTAAQAGVTPVAASDLATKDYVDTHGGYTPPTTEICVSNITGQGSAYFAVLTFGNTVRDNGGSDIQHVPSASLGSTFVIQTAGTYSLSVSATDPQQGFNPVGITRNASMSDPNSELANNNFVTGDNLYDITPGTLLISASSAIGDPSVAFGCTVTLPLLVNDVIRFQGGKNPSSGFPGANLSYEIANICRIN